MDIIRLIFSARRSAFLQMFALTLVSGALGIGTLSYINGHLLQNRQSDSGFLSFLLLVAAYFAAASYAQYRLAHLGQQFVCDMQTRLVKRILDSPPAQIQAIGKPKILASLASDIRSISIAFTRLPELVQGALFAAACSLYLLWLSPRLAAVAAVLLAILAAGTRFFAMRHFHSFRDMRRSEDEIQRHYETTLDGHKELTLNRTRAERFYQQEFIPQAESRRDTHIRADAYHAVLLNWSNAVMLAAVGIIFYLSERLGWADTSAAAAVSMTLLFMRGPFMSAVGAFPALLQSKVGLQALAELGLAEYRQDFDTAFRLPENWREIRLENVAYAYPAQGGDSFILQPSSLTLKRGETVFLVGGNGSGKSTLFMLLTGLYVPASGRIFVDDIEITAENRPAYRRLFAGVFTDFHLFEQLIDGMGEDAAEAQIDEWLCHLQLKGKAEIKRARILNRRLSQGQRKRLALLVAVLENRSIMVLDEWAADQDPEFRRTFYQDLLPLLKQAGYTVFAISHDDRYFNHADRVLLMRAGTLAEA